MLSPASNRRSHSASHLEQAIQLRRLGLDHQVRLAVSLVAMAAALFLALFSSPAAELPLMQAVDAPALKAKVDSSLTGGL
jgi:hypothetical protein